MFHCDIYWVIIKKKNYVYFAKYFQKYRLSGSVISVTLRIDKKLYRYYNYTKKKNNNNK